MKASTGPSRFRSSCVRTPTWRSHAADFGPTLWILLLSSLPAISAPRADRVDKYTRQTLHADTIVVVETRDIGTVDVPHADEPVAVEQRHDDFRLRRRIARDVALEFVD